LTDLKQELKGARVGEPAELAVEPDALSDPLAGGGRQLLKGDLTDDPVAGIAPRGGGSDRAQGHGQHQDDDAHRFPSLAQRAFDNVMPSSVSGLVRQLTRSTA
jgi:hypothetical protein